MTRKRARPRRRNYTPWIILGVMIAAVVIVGVLVSVNQNAQATPPVAGQLDKCGKPECGQANAPVTIEIYSDFQ